MAAPITQYFEVKPEYVGKTLRQLGQELGGIGRSDVMGNLFGFGEDTPLEKYVDTSKWSPGYVGSSSEFQGLQKFATPTKSPGDRLIDEQKTATDARFAANKQELGDFINKYSSAVPQIIQDTYKEFNVGDLLGYANALNTRIQDLKGNLTSEGAGGYASAGQVDKALNTNYLPRFLSASENANRAATIAQGQVGYRVAPFQTEASLLNDRLARENTGYTQQQQNELTLLLQKLNDQQQMTMAEYNRATELAVGEQRYNQELRLLEEKFKNDKALSSASTTNKDRYLSLGSGSSVFDMQTGKIIYKNPTSSGSSSGW